MASISLIIVKVNHSGIGFIDFNFRKMYRGSEIYHWLDISINFLRGISTSHRVVFIAGGAPFLVFSSIAYKKDESKLKSVTN